MEEKVNDVEGTVTDMEGKVNDIEGKFRVLEEEGGQLVVSSGARLQPPNYDGQSFMVNLEEGQF